MNKTQIINKLLMRAIWKKTAYKLNKNKKNTLLLKIIMIIIFNKIQKIIINCK